MDTKDKINNTSEDNNMNSQNNVHNEENTNSFVDNVVDVVKVAGKVGIGAAKTVGAVSGGAVKSVGFFAKFASFFVANIKASMIIGVVGAVCATVTLVVKDMLEGPKIENTANIVEEIKKISELTTACYYEESVLQNNKFTTKKHWIGNDVDTVKHTVVLTVMCRVRAGYDLSMLGKNDLVVKGDTVNIKLPAPKILDVISNPSDYRIFEETGDWKHDEIVAMQVQGKERMLQNALEDNILEKANIIGKERVATLFATFGFNVVNVTLTEVPTYVAPEQPEAAVE